MTHIAHQRNASIMTQMPHRGIGSAKSPDEKPSRDMGLLWDIRRPRRETGHKGARRKRLGGAGAEEGDIPGKGT